MPISKNVAKFHWQKKKKKKQIVFFRAEAVLKSKPGRVRRYLDELGCG
jgi:predicted ATPase